jgi:hypothetical protein
MVRKLLLVGCSVVFGLGVVVGSAWAQQGTCNNPSPFPANSEATCEQAGGTFDSEPGQPQKNTCTVVAPLSEVSAPAAPGCNKPSLAAGFMAKYQVTKTTVYTKEGGNCTVEEATKSTLVACYNSQGKPTSLQPCICPNPSPGGKN